MADHRIGISKLVEGDSLTQGELKKILHYNADTGVFTWVDRASGEKTMRQVGCLNPAGYKLIGVNGRRYMAHRLAFLYMIGRFPLDQTDHINHDRSDNRWINLREASNLENGRNISMKKNNKSGITGVHWNKQANNWRARIMVNGKTINIGSFENKKDAAAARFAAEREYGFHENHGVRNCG